MFQEGQDFHQFRVRLVHEPALNRYAIVQVIPRRDKNCSSNHISLSPIPLLSPKSLWRIVDYDRLREISAEDRQILDVVAVDEHTVLAEQTISDGRNTQINKVPETLSPRPLT